jgi:hypothetical protein
VPTQQRLEARAQPSRSDRVRKQAIGAKLEREDLVPSSSVPSSTNSGPANHWRNCASAAGNGVASA